VTGPAAPDDDASVAARLLAVDFLGLGGAWIRAASGPIRDRWLAQLHSLLGDATPWRKLPAGIAEARLLGGLDLAATLAAGRPVAESGLLAEADGGIVLAAMAERLAPETSAHLAAVLDRHEVLAERDGLTLRHPARIGLIALDEGAATDEAIAPALADRLAFHLSLDSPSPFSLAGEGWEPSQGWGGGALGQTEAVVATARARLNTITTDDATIEALCGTALALGIDSLRAPCLALRAAHAAAALAGHDHVQPEDAALAARLVLAPRATTLPADADDDGAPPPPEPETDAADSTTPTPEELADIVLQAALAAIPPNLLKSLIESGRRRGGATTQGKAGARKNSARRGRPMGARPGLPVRGARLALLDTLRAAAPWQRLRHAPTGCRIAVRRDDFRIRRFRERTATTTIFVVDASGSQALARLAEAKGAVELLLAECYVRRDQVALIGFRGQVAELLLPPTGALARARKSLAALPGGGATPLAAGIDAATALAEALRRRGQTPVVVLLTDGRANIARDGTPGRAQAEADALAAAQRFRAGGSTALLIDTSPRPNPAAAALAAAMGARNLPLPLADAARLAGAVQGALS
jgi:magnesium chelatase subunit D